MIITTKKSTSIGLVLCLWFVSFAAVCDNSPSAKTKYRQLVEVENDVSQGLLSASNVISDAKVINAISQEDIDFLKPILKNIGETNLKVIALIKTFPKLDEISPENQQQLIALINFISTSLTELNDEGALRIKDATKRLVFNSIVLTVQNSTTSIIRILNLRKQV